MDRPVITSTSNPRIQRARKLKRKADRDEAGVFLIENPMTLEAAAGAGVEVGDTFVDEDSVEIIERCEALDLQVTLVAPHVLKAVADTISPQGVVAVATTPQVALEHLAKELTLVLVLAGVSDPGNAGTLVRSAAASGADAVIFTDNSVDPYSPKTVRSSAGALFAMPVIRSVELQDALATLRNRGLCVYLAEAGEGPRLSDADLSAPVALVVGNEAHGIPISAENNDRLLSIPMPGGTESLNVAVAGSILLYETVRQRLGAGG